MSSETTPPRGGKPVPADDELWAPFWRSAGEGRFVVQQCAACGHLQFPARENCARCLRGELDWVPVQGDGTVYSFVVYHQTWTPGYQEELPYNVAIVELAEGPKVISHIVGVGPDDLRVGQAVTVSFEGLEDGRAVPHFRLVA
jgi:uncharacterized OB-fold protein